MRQVPHYLIIGGGRLARHLQQYFSLLKLSFSTWQRQQPLSALASQLPHASHVLIAISDSAIENFIDAHLKETKALRVHFSGSLLSDKAYGAHPLMTFNSGLYELNNYLTIPFVIDEDAPAFSELLPGLTNPHIRLSKSLKAKYHAVCVLGASSVMLWQKFFDTFAREFNIPAAIGKPYLQQQMQNLLHDPASALTGPIARGDALTIEKNINALAQDPFQDIYKSFVACYQKVKMGDEL